MIAKAVGLYRDHRILTWIGVTALTVRLMVVWPAMLTDTASIRQHDLEKSTRAFTETRFNVEDASQYFHEAGLIAKAGSMELLSGFRTPGYPLLLVGIFSLFGESIALVFILQAILGTAVVILIYRLSADMVGEHGALAASGIAAIDPHLIFYGVTLMTETLFLFLTLAGILLIWRSLQNGKTALLLAAGVLLGLATLVRPVMQFFPIVALGTIAVLSSVKWSKKVIASVAFLLGFMAAVLPWSARNAFHFGYFQVSSAAGLNLLHQHAAQTIALREGLSLKKVRSDLTKEARQRGATKRDMAFENLGIFSSVALEKIRQNWFFYPVVHVRGIIKTYLNLGLRSMARYFGVAGSANSRSFGEPLNGSKGDKTSAEIVLGIGTAIFLFCSYSASIAGGLEMIQRGYLMQLIFVFLMLGYFNHIAGPISGARFRLPCIPFYAVPAGLGVVSFTRYLMKQQRHD